MLQYNYEEGTVSRRLAQKTVKRIAVMFSEDTGGYFCVLIFTNISKLLAFPFYLCYAVLKAFKRVLFGELCGANLWKRRDAKLGV